jgi:hypothetical protein
MLRFLRFPFARRPVPIPIAILSFDRPQLLREVLLSLAPQVGQNPVFLFQDGARNIYSGRQAADPEVQQECIRAFREIFPHGTVFASEHNLGIAENYERAEREMFSVRNAPHALFLEDDLLLAPDFLQVTRMLLDLARQNPRIGSICAYGNLWASAEEQSVRPRDLIHAHESWGFAMTRKAWLEEQPFRRQYLQLVRGQDYKLRDDAPIMDFYRQRGWQMSVTSQDGSRWIAAIELGKVRLTTFPCHARNIGRVGVHSVAEFYDQARLASSIFYPGQPETPVAPTPAQIETWLAIERARFSKAPKPFYPGHATGRWP